MILTKDNLLRFVREKKAVTHADVAQEFDTSTMIASAALSEIAKEKSIIITHLKGSSSPYYYDPRQKEILVEIGQEKLSKGEKEIFTQLKNSQVISDNSLSIQEKLAIEKIKDFAIPLEIEHENKSMKFWVWFLRDIKETQKQILEAIKPQPQTKQPTPKTTKTQKTTSPKRTQQTIQKQIRQETQETLIHPKFAPKQQNTQPIKQQQEDNPYELFIENFLKQNYLKIDSKNKDPKGILYEVNLNLGTLSIDIDCYYFFKKPQEPDIIKLYTSSMKPKIIFIEKCQKKLLKLSQKIDNLTIINI